MSPLFLVAAAAAAQTLTDDFERGLCIGRCGTWPAAQQIDGRLEVVRGPAGGRALRARVEGRGARVPKAALIARPARIAPGDRVRVGFDLLVPQGAPLNSVHLVDLECARCGVAGNPGIRLYLRHGRLRIDRAKIGERDAWTDDAAPQLRHRRWHRVELRVTAGYGEAGRAEVRLDGATVLRARGDTIVRARGEAPGADRVQIGLTASSNPGPATAYFDNVSVTVER